MRRGTVILLALFLLLAAGAPFAVGDFRFNRQPELQQIKPKKPVMIRLKRTSKNAYTWELAGDDADEVVRVDRKLKKALGAQ